ncbi:MAG: hypothetical protein QW689_07180 [Nitrososphaerota archaeon]
MRSVDGHGGVVRKPGMSKLDLLRQNAAIIKDVAEGIKRYCHESIIMVVTNPVNLMAYILWRELALPRGRIVDMGGVLDTARRWGMLDCRTSDIVMGEHGDGMFIHG